eukprot:c10075_g1_i1.p1 GENE.c10075_g1_i1~~c10075_g1_i1.p1  ORF type:complete len:957 (-),score=342.18 c10075_g1_i1:216-3086(-)
MSSPELEIATLENELRIVGEELDKATELVEAKEKELEALRGATQGEYAAALEAQHIIADELKLAHERLKTKDELLTLLRTNQSKLRDELDASVGEDAKRAKEKLLAKDKQIEELTRKVGELEGHLEAGDKERDALEAEKEQCLTKIKVLEDKSTKLSEDLRRRELAAERAEVEVGRIREALAVKDTALAARDQALIAAQQARAEADTLATRLQIQIVELESKFKAATDSAITASRDATTALTPAPLVPSFEAELLEARSALERSGQNELTLKEAISALESRVTTLQSQVENEQQAARDLADQLAKSRAHVAEAEKDREDAQLNRQDLISREHNATSEKAIAEKVAREQAQASKSLEARASQLMSSLAEKTSQLERATADVAKLTNELQELKTTRLREAEKKSLDLELRLETAEHLLQLRDERVKELGRLVSGANTRVASTEASLTQVQSEMKNTKEVDVVGREQELKQEQAKAKQFESLVKSKDDRIQTISERLLSQREELKMRVEQLQLLHDKVRAKDAELLTASEKLADQEKIMVAQKLKETELEQRVTNLKKIMDTHKQTEETLQIKLAELNQRADLAEDEKRKMQDEVEHLQQNLAQADTRLKFKEDRIGKLHDRTQKVREDLFAANTRTQQLIGEKENVLESVKANDTQTQETKSTIARLEKTLDETQAQLEEAQRNASKYETEAKAKADEIQILKDAVASERASFANQQSVLEEQLRLKAADMEARVRADSVPAADTGVEAKFQKQLTDLTHLLHSKDQLIASATEKMQQAKREASGLLTEKETLAATLRKLNESIRTLEDSVLRANEERNLMSIETDAVRARVLDLEKVVVEREVSERAARDAAEQAQQAVANIKTQMLDMQHSLQSTTHKHTTPGPSDNSEVAKSLDRLSLLYFESLCLLVKTQLASTSPSSINNSAVVQDLFSEVTANQVPFEEWPTYIFARVYCRA